ncbi:MAG: RelA/SpoT family protein [Prevotellaceae bacterium]|jgi:GTP pyrophosphokinase|nr:RelA/SpoT family protein [Prevotellaceae bacterium]
MTEVQRIYYQAVQQLGSLYTVEERQRLLAHIRAAAATGKLSPERMHKAVQTAILVRHEASLGTTSITATLLYELLQTGSLTLETIGECYGKSHLQIVEGLQKACQLYEKNVAVETENFRMLLISLASDVRVILIMIVERLYIMRTLNTFSPDSQERIAREVIFLYAPLAHRMGLYAIKTEMEDMALKFTANKAYKEIAEKLRETKAAREQYIAEFITPVKERLQREQLSFDIKGRTKSIHSIWNKMQKQNVPFEKIYDLFAIRIILDVPPEKEKAACWQAFSIVADMYTPNTNRLRDWISIPKLNGYESLHITVMGPQGKWVEVQIRTTRMNEIAEKGLAAHWKYKGIKSDSDKTDEWLKNIRNMLEHNDANDAEVINEFKLQLYDDDVFIFTPKGDLFRLQKGATLLDFAYNIHTDIGNHCVGGIVNNRHVTLKYVLKNGDQVSVQTATSQRPNTGWLKWVVTARARTKIRQSLKDIEYKDAENGREILQRRLRNWKLDCQEADITRESKRLGYKSLSDFYQAVMHDKINLQLLHEALSPDKESVESGVSRSADGYAPETNLQKITSQDDALVIDRHLKDINYSFAQCCNPIFGDAVFGFVTISRGIKIHREDCPNAQQMRERFPYRVVRAQWLGEAEKAHTTANLHIVGRDDISIVTNITSLINRERAITMRSITVNSHDGLFEGNITVIASQIHQIEQLIKKIKSIKGVKTVIKG